MIKALFKEEESGKMNTFTLVGTLKQAGITVPAYVQDTVEKFDKGHQENTDNLVNQAFAGPARTFPRHTKAATYASAVQYILERNPDKGIGRELAKSAAFHGIEADYDELVQKLGATAKTKSAGFTKYALEAPHPDTGVMTRYLPLDTDTQIDGAMDELREVADRLPWEMRTKAAKAILGAAVEANRAATGYLRKAAMNTRPLPANVVMDNVLSRLNEVTVKDQFRVLQLTDRNKSAHVLDPHRTDSMYSKIAKALVPFGEKPLSLKNAALFIEAVDSADRLHDFHKKYAATMLPEEMVMADPQRDRWLVKLANGMILDMDEVVAKGMTQDDFITLGQGFTDCIKNTDLNFKSAAGGIDYSVLATAAGMLDVAGSAKLWHLVRNCKR